MHIVADPFDAACRFHKDGDPRQAQHAYRQAIAGEQLERRARENVDRAGVDPAGVEVVARRPRYDYLQLHERIDLALVSFPFNGHTTVYDGL